MPVHRIRARRGSGGVHVTHRRRSVLGFAHHNTVAAVNKHRALTHALDPSGYTAATVERSSQGFFFLEA